MKLISIAMTTFNGETYLQAQLDSILSQTYQTFELIICDDFSMDTTWIILSEYALRDHRIKLFQNQENIGFVKNFEKALRLCEGEYIALADQDDIWEPKKLSILMSEINNALLIHSDAYLIDANNTIFASSYTSYSNKTIRSDFIKYLFGNNVTGCTTLFRRKLLEYALPIPECIKLHDWWLALNASNHGAIHYYPKPLIRYRQHANNEIGASKKNTATHSLEERTKAYKSLITSLKCIRENLQLSLLNQQILDLFINYFEDYFNKSFRIRSFLFHLHYFKFFQEDKSFKIKFAALILSLFGYSIQKKLLKFFK
jgi:glycosyltransferase involved in cell wall biosynthesis